MTDKPVSLAAALAVLQTRLPRVGKDSAAIVPTKSGGAYGYKYADLPTISQAILPVLGELGLSFTCCPTLSDKGQLVLDYRLIHEMENEERGGQYPLGTGTPQQLGSAITYARRYCLCAVTGLAPDEDDDGQEAEDAAREMRRQPPEVDAHGAATFAEQTRMMSGPEPGTTRHKATDDDDPFYVVSKDGVRVPVADKDPAEDLPGSSLPSQRTQVHLHLVQLGYASPDAQRAECSRITGRPVESRRDLSYTEALLVLASTTRKDDASDQG